MARRNSLSSFAKTNGCRNRQCEETISRRGFRFCRARKRDRIEYALGSARESMVWYRAAEPILKDEIVRVRLAKLEEIRRMLLAVIPRERGRLIRPRGANG